MLDRARFITVDSAEAFVLSTTISVSAPVERAVLRATAHGVYEARIAGEPVGDGVLAPGWTAYEWRLQVQEHDVTSLVRDGALLEVLVGNGWWRGGLGFDGMNIRYGSAIGFIGELELTFADGATRWVTSGADWSARTAQVSANSIYDGQRIDAGHESAPLTVRTAEFDRSVLVPQLKPPIVRNEVLRPVASWTSPSGGTLVDFGQNLVGWVRLRARGRGEITVRHAEVLENGELATRPLRHARATDTFVLSGAQDEFEPTMTFHGFRYAEVTGNPGELDVEAVVVHSRMRRTGAFECSDPLVNRLVANSVWGQKGNFLDVPTDCPQRDERLGWTGDLAAYAATACFQFDCADLLHGWLLDLEAETRAVGCVPFVVPNVLKLGRPGQFEALQGPTAIWGDAAVWVPEALWWAYGDVDRLARHYPAMVLHLESILPRLSKTGLWDRGFQFGDWLDPTAPPEKPRAAKADPSVVATACLHRTALFAAEAARVLGFDEDSRRWRELAARTREAFAVHYVTADGRISSDAQTVYALAIHFGLLDGVQRAAAGERLAELVRGSGYRVATGFAGTPYVTWALTETGHVETAYRLLLQTENPSWLYAVTMGATTIWERWDSLLPDGSVNPGEMTSFNHYALGAVVDWLYKRVAGIQPAQPGYARLRLQPTPGPGLDWARATLDTVHGQVACGWRRTPTGITVECRVPEGVAAEVVLPDGAVHTATAGTHTYRTPQPTNVTTGN